jgi:hypothetical protein
MTLYFIEGSDNNGDSVSLFVRADGPQEAFDIWKAHDVGSGWSTCFEGVLSSEPPDEACVDDLRFFEVPESGPAGAIEWHKMPGVNVVAHVNPI